MRQSRWWTILCVTAIWAAAPAALAQRNPDIGYVYPAGGQRGTTLEVKMAGRYLDGVANVVISGAGVEATVERYVKPLNGKEIALLRDRLKELQQMMSTEKAGKADSNTVGVTDSQAAPDTEMDPAAIQKEMIEIKGKLGNPKNQNRNDPQLAEDVVLHIVVAPDAEPGRRELRLKTALGLSNPVVFYVGQLPEYTEKEPNNGTADDGVPSVLPLVINGQIMPGDVDRFKLKLTKGTRLVATAGARELIPYLADAVPGWFQATLALSNANGDELAYDDDYRFQPDPVLFCEIPEDGEYVLEIKDAIYRGREDFVYRLTVGELPFVTSIFPLGGKAGTETTVEIKGWNLPTDKLVLDTKDKEPGLIPVSVLRDGMVSNCVPFAVGTLPECTENESNDSPAVAQQVTLPMIVNGRIDKPGDHDVFRFEGRAGDNIVGEVCARRLDWPLDSVLELTDANGNRLAFNDDHDDKEAGLTTHHADSLLNAILPADGTYYLRIADAQNKGGAAYGYRLRISPPQPDFALRVVPSSINARAGASATITVYAVRKDGFANDITVSLQDAPSGFALSGGRVPAGKDETKVTLRMPPTPMNEPVSLRLEGRAVVEGREIVRPAVPADDMMQAFIYRHLVVAKDLKVMVGERWKPQAGAKSGDAKKTDKPAATGQAKPQ